MQDARNAFQLLIVLVNVVHDSVDQIGGNLLTYRTPSFYPCSVSVIPAGGRQYDIVIASYCLGELEPLEQQRAVRALWQATGKMLILVEPGTPSSSALVRAARQEVI